MKKEEFIALGISQEMAVKAAEASKKELEGYVPKDQLDTANAENKTLKQSVSDRDKQLEELKKSSGDNAELKKQIETLQQQNHFRGFQPGASGDNKPGANADISKMSYEELAAYIENNPDAE